MNRFLALFLFLIFTTAASAQDKILLNDSNKTIECTILEVTDNFIWYKTLESEGGLVKQIAKSEYKGFELENFSRDKDKIKVGNTAKAKKGSVDAKKPVGQYEYITNSILDIGIGVGPNYGLTGVKIVAGKGGSGLMLGAGRLVDLTPFEVGVQGTVGWWFINLGYGSYSIALSSNGDELINGLVLTTGGKLNMAKGRMFLELAIGLGVGGTVILPIGLEVPLNAFIFGGGLNFRLSD